MKRRGWGSVLACVALAWLSGCGQQERPAGPRPSPKDQAPQAAAAPAPPAPQGEGAPGQPYTLQPPKGALPSPLPAGVTSLKSIREQPEAFVGKELTVLGTVAEAVYGGDLKDCAFAFRVSDGTSEAWVLPLSKTTPDLGKSARLKATVLRQPDRPWAAARADAFYLQAREWSYEKR
jgi:hypothetical protein